MGIVALALGGDRRAVARLISLMERGGSEARQAVAELYPHTGQAHIVGVTGAPGTGKSTLVNELAKAYRQQDFTVGIVAVDPTSPFSGGALLGDRIRMRDVTSDPGIFVRSMASRGTMGGLARATADAVHVLDAAGYSVILVETVGAGQSEVEIARIAHTTLVLQMPGSGDEIQAIKAGILEIADIVVVNKADLPGAENTVEALRVMLDLNSAHTQGHHGRWFGVENLSEDTAGAAASWRPPLLKTSAIRGEGIDELMAAIQAHWKHQCDSGLKAGRERERVQAELDRILRRALLDRLLNQIPDKRLQSTVRRVVTRELDPYSAAEQLIAASRLVEEQAGLGEVGCTSF